MAQLRGEERARYVSRMFGCISQRYDLLNTVMTGGMHYAWRRLAAYTAVGSGLTGAALDVACGTGDFAFDIARKPNIEGVVGLDFVPQMLTLARGKASRQKLSARTTFTVGDAHALPFTDDSFICATVGFGVRNFIDVPHALSEMARVVQPGGRVVVLEIVRMEDGGLHRRVLPWCFQKVAPILGALLAGDGEAYSYLPQSVEEFLSARQLVEVLEGAGLKNVRRRSLALGMVAIVSGEVPASLRES